MQIISGYLAVLLVFGVIDLAWLMLAGPLLYRPVLGDILLPSPRLAPAAAFYLLFPVGIWFFAVRPALETNALSTAIIYGALFGALAYATYDLTNYATLRNWTLQITLVDIAYGALACAFAATIAVLALRYLPASLGGISG